MTINPESTVAELVTANFDRVKVFERFSIDYCCGGNISLTEACSKKGVDTGLVQELLQAADQQPAAASTNWQERSLAELADHIMQNFHIPLRAELARLGELFAHVDQKHGSDHLEIREAAPLFERLRQLLLSHMAEEEAVLFPLCTRLDEARSLLAWDAEMEGVLRAEHEEVGLELERLRELLGDYEPPEGACRKYMALLAGLSQLERDIHEHVHLENNILLARAREASVQS